MLYCTVNIKSVKRTLIVLSVFICTAVVFCLWALMAHGNPNAAQTGQALEEESYSRPFITVVTDSDAAYTAAFGEAAVSDSSVRIVDVPANVNLNPFSLNQSICLPLESAFISSDFGYRDHPINGRYSFHGGLDLASAEGSPIYAMLDGTVSKAEYHSSYGNYVVISHEEGVQTLYAHCLTLCVQPGDTVTKGTKVAEVGMTGSATGPHLHVELRYEGQRFDPSYLLGDNYS